VSPFQENPAAIRTDRESSSADGSQTAHDWLKKTFRGEFEDRPLYIMLCCTHLGLEVRYGALQLQILYARSEEIQSAVTAAAKPIPILRGQARKQTRQELRVTRKTMRSRCETLAVQALGPSSPI